MKGVPGDVPNDFPEPVSSTWEEYQLKRSHTDLFKPTTTKLIPLTKLTPAWPQGPNQKENGAEGGELAGPGDGLERGGGI